MQLLRAGFVWIVCCPVLFAQNGSASQSFGNLRDPLNVHFADGTATHGHGIPANLKQASPYTEMLGDARLNDVFFVNPLRGWAVGDRGVIWTTADGGLSWRLQDTPIDSTLRSVQFINESFGIAVGNYWFPHTALYGCQGRGVILTTHNGGQSWQLRHTPDLPPLYRVQFFDATTILVAGATSEHCPSGILLSSDAGKTWQPVIDRLSDGFVDADFSDIRSGIGIGFHGILQQIQPQNLGGISASQTALFGLRHVSAVRINGLNSGAPITGWAVGDRGLILSTPDQGLRWGVAPGMLPGYAAETVDLKTVEVRGRNIWVAGNPGTNIFVSQDGGQSWQAAFTGSSACIRKIVFIDENTGWAVGDLGTILATQNGGKTWTPQRHPGSKLSVLGIFGESGSIPFETFAALSANQGFLGGCVLLFRNEKNSHDLDGRLHEAVIRSGGSIGMELDTFPVLPKELWTTLENLNEYIQRTTDGRGLALLREKLVVTIKQYRPEIILTSNYTNPYTDSPVEKLVKQEVLEAVKLAGDPTAYPHHLPALGLSPWNVKKIYLTLKNNMPGDVHVTTLEPTVRFGIPLEEMAYIPRKLVDAPNVPSIQGFILQPSSDINGKDFFAGIQFLQTNEGRREYFGIHADFQDEHRRRALQRRNTLGLLQNVAKNNNPNDRYRSNANSAKQIVSRENIATHAAELTKRLDPDSAVQTLINIAEQFHQEGDWHAATETYLILTQNYSRHPLVRQAFIRVMQYSASGEILAGELKEDGASVELNEWVDDPRRPGHRVLKTTTVRRPVQGGQITQQQHERTLSLGQFLDHVAPDIADTPAMRFAIASVLRKIGNDNRLTMQRAANDVAKYYQARSHSRFDDVWSIRARTEQWLAIPDKTTLPAEQQQLPMPAIVSVHIDTRPFLDGKFDDEHDKGVWQRANLYPLTPGSPPVRAMFAEGTGNTGNTRRIGAVREERLRAMSQNFGTQAMFLRDSEYLYIGLRCPKVPEFNYTASDNQQRLRDVGMQDQDRVEILLDIDRDYDSYYSLTIDFRGWVTDMCLGNRGWNPHWQVARREDDNAWYIEAAIPFASLLDRPVVPHSIWSIALRRLVPGIGIECWNAENSFDLTEGFGLLVL